MDSMNTHFSPQDAYPTGAQDVDLWLRLGMLARQRGQRVERLGPNFRRFFRGFGVKEVRVQDVSLFQKTWPLELVHPRKLANDNETFQPFEDVSPSRKW